MRWPIKELRSFIVPNRLQERIQIGKAKKYAKRTGGPHSILHSLVGLLRLISCYADTLANCILAYATNARKVRHFPHGNVIMPRH